MARITELTHGDLIHDPRRDGEPAEVIGFGHAHFRTRTMVLALRHWDGVMRAAHYHLDEDLQLI